MDANGFVLGQNQTAVGVYSNSDKFQGNMGEFSIFRRALNDAQIDSMYRSGVTGTESDLALYLPMKDMVGETLVDRSTQARDGRIVSLDVATAISFSPSQHAPVADQGMAIVDASATTPLLSPLSTLLG